ncbi:STAS/SEC14 domain-containing protein [Aeromonas hydrophila]|uniref:STAS/SEC14 domain-containing protein n=1 Tax=Aeromonas hydrophila TaxID=644 RepID=UPI00080A99D1|nr:STAS/SEC14 domain-containing protein [Aeromonas hydrophila]ANT67977.1 hypothetical protein TK34_11120 [Aeromonas hydrophila]HDN9021049.1 STAS/SEC14 domain-containing protein [Aeromonas salmonicida]
MFRNLQHGSYKIEPVSKHLLTCELSGTFNMEGMQAWVDDMKACIHQQNGDAVGLLIDARLYTGGTAEALEIAENFHKFMLHSAVIAQAHVISSPTLYAISLHLIPSLKGHTVKNFLRMDEATQWITEQVQKFSKEGSERIED